MLLVYTLKLTTDKTLETRKRNKSRQLRATMESAWEEVENLAAGPGAGVGDPDLQAVWDDQDDAAGGIETLEGVWGRTAARLEAGEGQTKLL